jgi:hypothetical protein
MSWAAVVRELCKGGMKCLAPKVPHIFIQSKFTFFEALSFLKKKNENELAGKSLLLVNLLAQ